ncbi:hypothetical protein NC651_009768 [Populus alba x Populus x berolinensis]|nr:hypothetical protein NC651_009768 [Populus alba x Populus x berolinensis]
MLAPPGYRVEPERVASTASASGSKVKSHMGVGGLIIEPTIYTSSTPRIGHTAPLLLDGCFASLCMKELCNASKSGWNHAYGWCCRPSTF